MATAPAATAIARCSAGPPPNQDYGKAIRSGARRSLGAASLSIQAEYLRRTLKADTAASDIKASGYYTQLAYTLTGEPRIYKLDGARFDTIKPQNKALGAWELFYRYDAMKVEDDNVVASSAVRQVGDAQGKSHTLGSTGTPTRP